MDLFQNKCYFINEISKKTCFNAVSTPKSVLYRGGKGNIMSQDKMPELLAVGESHQGCVRSHNEDNYLCISNYGGYCFAAVADGVGGHSAGERASYLCCHRLMLEWKALFKSDPAPTDARITSFLMDSVILANKDITGLNRMLHKKHHPMCTTLAAAVFTPQMVIVVHVGDSRVYCSRQNSFNLLTIDHTVQNELVEHGITAPEQLPSAHVISKAIGSDRYLKPELHTFFRTPQDRYLLCTDGLTNCLSNVEINKILAEAAAPRQAKDRLIRQTLMRGAADNVTVVAVFPKTDKDA